MAGPKNTNDSSLFRSLVDQYSEPLYWHVRNLVCSHEDADDIVQETFIKAWKALPSFRGDSSPSTWLWRIATNEALRLLGRQKGDMMLSLDEVTADMLGTKTDAHFDSSDVITMKLQQAILHLPAKQQLAFNLRYYDELSYEEIAEVAGSTAASMKVSYNIAKEKIIAYMNNND